MLTAWAPCPLHSLALCLPPAGLMWGLPQARGCPGSTREPMSKSVGICCLGQPPTTLSVLFSGRMSLQAAGGASFSVTASSRWSCDLCKDLPSGVLHSPCQSGRVRCVCTRVGAYVWAGRLSSPVLGHEGASRLGLRGPSAPRSGGPLGSACVSIPPARPRAMHTPHVTVSPLRTISLCCLESNVLKTVFSLVASFWTARNGNPICSFMEFEFMLSSQKPPKPTATPLSPKLCRSVQTGSVPSPQSRLWLAAPTWATAHGGSVADL